MQGISAEKVAGGKLLRVKVDFGIKINEVRITGDFFAHPEDVIEKIENSLSGLDLHTSEIDIQNKIENMMAETGADIVGIDAAAITRNLMKALGVLR